MGTVYPSPALATDKYLHRIRRWYHFEHTTKNGFSDITSGRANELNPWHQIDYPKS